MADNIPLIQVLSEVVQNKIAAGEVVERPASVVKELAENSLDAGAQKILIDIEEGGSRLLRVSDDGCGMNKENLALCIERHATSKIADVEDIFHINTMGFRGEALPSIGSVSRLSITTCRAGSDEGLCLKLAGGENGGIMPAPPRKGTAVEVRDLFFNTPARRKFMKSASAEVSAINEVITRLALANPSVSFRINNNGKTTIELPAHATLAERITAIFGHSLQLLPVERDCGDGAMLVSGFCARPPESRANSRYIYTFLNGRWIKHPGIARAVADAYQGSLPPRRYPFAVLNLQIDPSRVDVNVHPAKEVVRFENDSLAVGGCRKAVQEAIQGGTFFGELENARKQNQQHKNAAADAAAAYITSHRAERPTPAPSSSSATANPAGKRKDFSAIFGHNSNSPKTVDDNSGWKKPTFTIQSGGQATPLQPSAGSQLKPDKLSVIPDRSKPDFSKAETVDQPGQAAAADTQQKLLDSGFNARLLGQAGGKYLIVEREDGIMLVDQHALHERWNYERLKKQRRQITSQRLLIPVVIELTPAESAITQQALPVLVESGFEAELSGENRLEINAHPDLVKPAKIEQVVRDVLADVESSPLEELEDHLIASLACHSAVLFGTPLPPESCMALLEKYKDGPLLTCPHGRPTAIVVSWKELVTRFGR